MGEGKAGVQGHYISLKDEQESKLIPISADLLNHRPSKSQGLRNKNDVANTFRLGYMPQGRDLMDLNFVNENNKILANSCVKRNLF